MWPARDVRRSTAAEGRVVLAAAVGPGSKDTRVPPFWNHALPSCRRYEVGRGEIMESPKVGSHRRREGVKAISSQRAAWRGLACDLEERLVAVHELNHGACFGSLARVAVPGRCSHPRRTFRRLAAVKSHDQVIVPPLLRQGASVARLLIIYGRIAESHGDIHSMIKAARLPIPVPRRADDVALQSAVLS